MLKTLRVKLLGFFFLTSLMPLLFIGYVSYQAQKQELINHIEHSLLIYCDELALDIESLLAERVADVKWLALNPVLKNREATSSEIKEQFEDFLNIYGIYSDTIFVNSDGIAEVSFSDKLVGRDLSDRKWFQISKNGRAYLSDIYYSNYLNEPIIAISAPVRDYDGNIIGVISPLFDLTHMWETLNKFSNQELMVALDGHAFLINKEGQIIGHPDQAKILTENYFEKNNVTVDLLVEKSRSREIYYDKENNLVLSYVKVNKTEGFNEDWFIGIYVSKDALFSPLQQLLTKYLIIIGLVLLLTTLAVIKLSKYIVSPVERLVSATSNIASGKPIEPLISDTYEEINRLNNTFTTMTEKLADRERGHKKSTLIIETSDNGVLAINKKTLKITTFNRTCEELFKVSKQEAINETVFAIKEKSICFHEFIEKSNILRFMDNEKTKKFEFNLTCHDKTYHFFISISCLPSIENEGIHEEMLIIINDLTEKRKMRDELIRSEKLKVAGEMAASLAHEIRNPLTIIKGFIQLFKKDAPNKERSHYDLVINEIDRVNYFITDLLNIAKPNAISEKRETNLVCMLDDLLTLQKTQLYEKGIQLVKNFEQVPTVFIDRNKLQQVFINIIQNAVESMKKNDCLTINVKRNSNENEIEITIKDTGCGMSKETQEKLWTPFYTTKTAGTGLGLPTSYRLLEEIGGKISVSSELNSGSTFKVFLPLNKEPD